MAHIRTTWTNFIEQTHVAAVDSRRASPWELVALETESLGRRVGSNQNIFPVTDIFQLLLHYDVDKFRSIGEDGNITGERTPEAENPIEWVIDIFFRLGAPIENLVSVVEAMWYAKDVPFNSRHGRKLLAKWLVVIVEKWWAATRREEEPFGGTENALGLADVLRVVAESGDFGGAGASGEDREWGDRLRVVRGRVEEVLR
jgi:nuclear pore complex protein Nup155